MRLELYLTHQERFDQNVTWEELKGSLTAAFSPVGMQWLEQAYAFSEKKHRGQMRLSLSGYFLILQDAPPCGWSGSLFVFCLVLHFLTETRFKCLY